MQRCARCSHGSSHRCVASAIVCPLFGVWQDSRLVNSPSRAPSAPLSPASARAAARHTKPRRVCGSQALDLVQPFLNPTLILLYALCFLTNPLHPCTLQDRKQSDTESGPKQAPDLLFLSSRKPRCRTRSLAEDFEARGKEHTTDHNSNSNNNNNYYYY